MWFYTVLYKIKQKNSVIHDLRLSSLHMHSYEITNKCFFHKYTLLRTLKKNFMVVLMG